MSSRPFPKSMARAGHDPAQELAGILVNPDSVVLENWLRTLIREPGRSALSRKQAEAFFGMLGRAVARKELPSRQRPEWVQLGEFLLSAVGAAEAGLIPSEVTQPLNDLKQSLFTAIRGTYRDPETQMEVSLYAASVLDGLGILLADAVHIAALKQARTSREDVEAALIHTKEFKERIVESSPDCLKVLDADARLMWMSQHGKQLMEVCEFGQIRGANWLDFWEGGAQESARRAVAKAQAGSIGRFEGPCTTMCGTPKWWNVVVAPILDERGEVAQLLSVSRDVTEQKRVETELRKREIELEQAIGFRENLLAVVSHDLRSPLSVINLNIAMLQRQTSDDWIAKRLTAVEHASERMLHLIEDLLDMAGIQAGRLSIESAPQDISALLREAVAMHQPLAKSKGIDIGFSTSVAAKIDCDRERILQVAGNLIGNAIKFSGSGDAISVDVSADDEFIQFDVADTGPGIATDHMPHLFDVYWSAQKDRTGAGLGLFICKGIIEAHGGRIWAESPAGAGARFSVELPRR